jgi:hypothetical protein
MIEFTVQRVGPSGESLLEALMPFACSLFPSLHISQAFFQGGSPFGHLRVLDGCLGKTVIGVQTERK